MKQEFARESASAKSNFRISRVPFSEIPGQSRLFLDYLGDPNALKRFYPNVVSSPEQLDAFCDEMLSSYSTDRTSLCDALAQVNLEIGASELAMANIQLLRHSETVAVVTGQQAGLFTGPLYTIYKALSACALADKMNRSGRKAVPVFWAATEDHDFEEVSESFFVGKTGELMDVRYRPDGTANDIPVGNVRIGNEISGVIENLFQDLPATGFSASVRDLLSECWAEDAGFGKSFLKTLARLLGKYGLIFLDPQSAGIKQLSSKIYVAAIEKADEAVAGITENTRELNARGYHGQVLVEDDYFPLFWHDDNGVRSSIRKIGPGRYRAKSDKREFTVSELAEIAESQPQRFSPGVMLRPVVQDHLLPTACYFGGGAEIAYFAQNSAVYEVLGRPVTPVFHRQSFTVTEAKHQRTLERLSLNLQGLFAGMEDTIIGSSASSIAPEMARLFGDVEERINTELNRLDQNLSSIDKTLAENLAKRRRKIIYHIAALRKKALLAQVRNDETLNRQIEQLFAFVLPNGQLQERVLNVFTFVNKFGPNFIDWIYDAIDLEDKDHRIIGL